MSGHGPDGFYLFDVAHEDGLPGQTERGYGQLGRHLPRLIDDKQVDGIVEGHGGITLAAAGHIARKRMEGGDEHRHHAGQPSQTLEVDGTVRTVQVSGATAQTTDELGLTVVDGIPEHLVAVTDVQAHGHVFHAGQVPVLLSFRQPGVACPEIVVLLPAGHGFFVGGRSLAEVLHHPDKQILSSIYTTGFFLCSSLQARFNPVPQQGHLSTKVVLTLCFILARGVEVTVEQLQVVRAVLVHPLRIVVRFGKALSSGVQHHGIAFGKLFLSGQVQA